MSNSIYPRLLSLSLLFWVYGTVAEGTTLEAASLYVFWSSKKICAPNAFNISVFDMPPRKKDSSIRTFHARSVFITRLCAGAFLLVTSAVRIFTGESP